MKDFLSEMKMENKCIWIIEKEYLNIGIESKIKGMKCVVTKYGKKLVIIYDFKREMTDLFGPKCFDSKAADHEIN